MDSLLSAAELEEIRQVRLSERSGFTTAHT
jgi:hypothetical protein